MNAYPAWHSGAALTQLAQRCGIADNYQDLSGKSHTTRDNTRCALLAAMRFSPQADPATLLQELDEQEWRRPLPPVMVVPVGHTPRVPVSLSISLATRPHRWVLTAEDGATMVGEFLPTELSQCTTRRVGELDMQRGELSLPVPTHMGYYRLEVEQTGREGPAPEAMTLVVAPPASYQPQAITGDRRAWGLTVQLYGLRSKRNWGIGDFSDLRSLVDLTADAGGGTVGVNPLHALFPHDPQRVSPYSPSNRCFSNILYIDVEAVPEFSECPVARALVASDRFQARLRRLRACEQVNYTEVSAVKREVLSRLHGHFRRQHLAHDTERAASFRQFCQAGGKALEAYARFEALQAHLQRIDPDIWGWPAWPQDYAQPTAPAVAAFAAEHSEAVEFFAWLQWLADAQLAGVGLQSWRRRLGVGLYQDLAVGVDPSGSEAWMWQDAFAAGAGASAYIGAPPDDLCPAGQDWGLAPFIPHRLRAMAYAPFIAILRANMRHSGALRLDHVMALTRLFWVPAGVPAEQGAYVSYPQDDLHGILALESVRNRCLVVGEDLGAVPQGLRPRLGAAGVHPVAIPELTQPFMIAVHAYLAKTPAQLMVVQAEDVLGVADQANLPGSRDDQHPNWRRRLPLDLEDWALDARFSALVETLRQERGAALVSCDQATVSHIQAVIPRATYRLQFNADFTFAAAAALAPYLAELGVSQCYASSYLKARAGSSHGYDIVDHGALNPEIGTPEDYECFCAALKAQGLGQILDVVPNHMGIMGADNAWWLDVLENGQASVRGRFFDIDWQPLNANLRDKVLLPLLGDHYGSVLNRGELRLTYDSLRGEFSLFYYQHRLPIDPASYPRIVGHHSERLAAAIGADHPHFIVLQTLLTAFGRLPPRTDTTPARMAERQRDKEVHKRHLATLSADCADIAQHITDNVQEFNGSPGDAASFDLLHELIRLQGYRLAYWRVASDEINYRRFFDINDLAALRMEEPVVFEATHRFVLDLLAQGKVDGLRIDHPDGLYDPGEYFQRLQRAVAGRHLAPGETLPLYLVVEKILADHERLPAHWPIHGATGYRFSNLVNKLFVDGASERRMTRIYHDFTGVVADFNELAYDAKKLIVVTALAGELNVLANRLASIAGASRDTCDFTLNGLRDAVVEVTACFPVYRSYVAHDQVSADDRKHIGWAVAVAKRRCPAADTGIFDFLQAVLSTDFASRRSASLRERVLAFAMKFQQFSSPVMAKGVEDTAFYRYHRLISLNDVGADPHRFGASVAAFHAATQARFASWPHNMLATSTHDSKRSEDVRARLDVLSEMPSAWKLMLQRWSRMNRARKLTVDDCAAPSRNDEFLLYQTLIGSWPLATPDEAALSDYRARIEAYMIKALREAKEHSSWVNINTDYETAMRSFVQSLLAWGDKNLFLVDFVSKVQAIAHFGLLNSLAQTLIKLTSPGVPDIYQGCELWQFNLVDPDNRRPVDFTRRQQLLGEVKAIVAAPPAQWPQRLQPLLADMTDGRIKLYTLWQSLTLRAALPQVFRDGHYLPLAVQGPGADHACAFARKYEGCALIVLVPRLSAQLLKERPVLPLGPEVWGDTMLELPGDLANIEWTNVLTGETCAAAPSLRVGQLLTSFPVALLITKDCQSPHMAKQP